jgi:hypothetical protein
MNLRRLKRWRIHHTRRTPSEEYCNRPSSNVKACVPHLGLGKNTPYKRVRTPAVVALFRYRGWADCIIDANGPLRFRKSHRFLASNMTIGGNGVTAQIAEWAIPIIQWLF